MNISLENIGKRYQHEWIFQGIDATYSAGETVAILGSNGSGKSTYLQVLSGYLTPSEGSIFWEIGGKESPIDKLYKEVSLVTPYMTLYDDFTMQENVAFFQRFKKFRDQLKGEDIASITGLEKHWTKQLRFFSSGMKQRVKLALAILSETSLLLLDEPCSHLDAKAIDWYQDILRNHRSNRTLFVASNQQFSETFLCERTIGIEQYKKKKLSQQ